MKLFKTFIFLSLFPTLLIGLIDVFITGSFADFTPQILFFTIGFFLIIALNYVYVFEKSQVKKVETFKNLLITIVSVFVSCFTFGLVYQIILASELQFLTATFQGLLAIVILILEFAVIKISENKKQQNNLVFNEKPWVYILIICSICLTETLFLFLFGIELLQIEALDFVKFFVDNFLLRTLTITTVSMVFLYIFSSLKFIRNNLYIILLLTTLLTYLSFFAFGFAVFKQTIIVNYLILAFTSTVLSALIILYRNNRKVNKMKIDFLTKSVSKKESEYLQLKNQVNPHFLFNNLNTLLSFIEIEPKKAIEFGHNLSNVYRHYLKSETEDFVSLSEELMFINEYLEIYKAKFETGFTFEVEKNVPKNLFIVSFSLQEIIDNIFKHNILDDNNKIEIKIFVEDDYLKIYNSLNLQNNTISHKKGLQNIKERNKILLDKEISINQNKTCFEIKVPIIKLEN